MSNLSGEDIVLMGQTIELAQTRGAFKAQEMVPIGQLYIKLCKILEEAKKKHDEKVEKKEKK